MRYFRKMKSFKGVPFNVSVFRMETGQELYSIQIRTTEDRILKFNLGEKSELTSDPKIPILQKMMDCSFVVVECPKDPEGQNLPFKISNLIYLFQEGKYARGFLSEIHTGRKFAKAIKRKLPVTVEDDDDSADDEDDDNNDSDSDKQQMPGPPAAASGGKKKKNRA